MMEHNTGSLDPLSAVLGTAAKIDALTRKIAAEPGGDKIVFAAVGTFRGRVLLDMFIIC